MGIFGIAKKGFGLLGRKSKNLKSSKISAIKSVKPGVGGLKTSRKAFEGFQESAATGVKKFGRLHTNKVLSEQGVKKGIPGLTKQMGDVERKRKKLGIKKDYSGYEKK